MSSISPTTILLVDGYNIIGLWSDLQQIRDNYGLEPARRALTERLGDVGRKLHTGRSRNDQVSTDLCCVTADKNKDVETIQVLDCNNSFWG